MLLILAISMGFVPQTWQEPVVAQGSSDQPLPVKEHFPGTRCLQKSVVSEPLSLGTGHQVLPGSGLGSPERGGR